MIATILPFLNQFWPAMSTRHPGFRPLLATGSFYRTERFEQHNSYHFGVYGARQNISSYPNRRSRRIDCRVFREYAGRPCCSNYRVAKQCLLFDGHYYRKHFQNRQITSMFFFSRRRIAGFGNLAKCVGKCDKYMDNRRPLQYAWYTIVSEHGRRGNSTNSSLRRIFYPAIRISWKLLFVHSHVLKKIIMPPV